MAGDPMRLRQFSRHQLIEELARRANEAPTAKPERWCHDCRNFVSWNDQEPPPRRDMPEDYNPCTKRHKMRFVAPDEIDDEYGFYLPVCADRDEPTSQEAMQP